MWAIATTIQGDQNENDSARVSDYLLTETDLVEQRVQPDVAAPTTFNQVYMFVNM